MMYCTHCGSDMKGSKTSCPVCGYRVEKMKEDLKAPRAVRSAPREEERRPWAPPIPDQRRDGFRKKEARIEEDPPEPEYEEERPTIRFGSQDEGHAEEAQEQYDPTIVSTCSFCSARPETRCFFCLSPICRSHIEWMQILVRATPIGDRVKACPTCSRSKEGRNPTVSEADEAGMLFSIKPYHVWTRVK